MAGAVQFSATLEGAGAAARFVGAPGAGWGVSVIIPDEGPVPAAFSADTLNSYARPFASPVTVAAVLPDVPPVPLCSAHAGPPAGRYSTTYPIITPPPSSSGAAHSSQTDEVPCTDARSVGAPGTSITTTVRTAGSAPLPALSRHRYDTSYVLRTEVSMLPPPATCAAASYVPSTASVHTAPCSTYAPPTASDTTGFPLISTAGGVVSLTVMSCAAVFWLPDESLARQCTALLPTGNACVNPASTCSQVPVMFVYISMRPGGSLLSRTSGRDTMTGVSVPAASTGRTSDTDMTGGALSNTTTMPGVAVTVADGTSLLPAEFTA